MLDRKTVKVFAYSKLTYTEIDIFDESECLENVETVEHNRAQVAMDSIGMAAREVVVH